MNHPVRYGQIRSEKMTEENQVCRKIVREINNFGVSERQRLLIIYLLGLELENVEQMQAVTSTVKDVAGEQIFVSDAIESGGPGGTPDL